MEEISIEIFAFDFWLSFACFLSWKIFLVWVIFGQENLTRRGKMQNFRGAKCVSKNVALYNVKRHFCRIIFAKLQLCDVTGSSSCCRCRDLKDCCSFFAIIKTRVRAKFLCIQRSNFKNWLQLRLMSCSETFDRWMRKNWARSCSAGESQLHEATFLLCWLRRKKITSSAAKVPQKKELTNQKFLCTFVIDWKSV